MTKLSTQIEDVESEKKAQKSKTKKKKKKKNWIKLTSQIFARLGEHF